MLWILYFDRPYFLRYHHCMNIPIFITEIIKKIEAENFEIFVVGGAVRDLVMEREVKDWDLTTNARPEQIVALFENAKYENAFGTVIIPVRDEAEKVLSVVEVTTYRSEQGYSDRRHPDEVVFEDQLENDLARRDFTVNALALQIHGSTFRLVETLMPFITEFDGGRIIDLFGGVKDIKKRVVRAVGEPADRFREDALRMIRAIRFAAQLGFEIEPKTERAIAKLAGGIKFVAKERVRDELVKILSSNYSYEGIKALHDTKLLQYLISELEDGVGVAQNKHHIYTIFDHNMLALKHCPNPDWHVRLAALLHDVGKVKTKKLINGEFTFYNHEYVGAKITERIMARLKFSNDDKSRIVNLVRNHMFYYNNDEVTAASVRRLISKVGRENLRDLIDLRIADRLGSGVPKAKPYKLRHLEYMFERVQNDPVSVKDLKINGTDLMQTISIPPSPKIGQILDCLLAEVLENPEENVSEKLLAKAAELNKMSLEDLRKKAKEVIMERRREEDKELKRNFKV